MNTVDVTGKRQKVNVMRSPLREAMGRSGAVLYFMGHLREPGGMSVVLWGCSNAGPGQVRRVQRRDLQDGSCALALASSSSSSNTLGPESNGFYLSLSPVYVYVLLPRLLFR